MDEREQAWLFIKMNRDKNFRSWWYRTHQAPEGEDPIYFGPEWCVHSCCDKEVYLEGSFWKPFPWNKLPDSVRVRFLETVADFGKYCEAGGDFDLVLKVEAAILEYDINRAVKILGRKKFNALQNDK